MKIVIKGNPEEIAVLAEKIRSQQVEPDQKEILHKLSWGMQHEDGSQDVDVFPMNGEKIVIHGKQEADLFCKMLTSAVGD